jgi:uncharacterized membrane protein HdeD (DUF308 family)
LFYLIAFVLILVGIFGIIFAFGSLSRLTSLLILILGIIAAYIAACSIAQPLYIAIIVGICLIMEGIAFLTSSAVETV